MNATILIVDDDKKTVDLIRAYLVRDGYRVVAAYDGARALELAREKRPDLVILDIMLPGLDGISVCRTLQEESGIAVILLTARITEDDRLEGLSAGADDYVIKPFSPRELAARVKAVLRRLPGAYRIRGPSSRRSGELHLDMEKHIATLKGRQVKLTPTEFKLLWTMMGDPGRVFTRDQLAEIVYGHDFEGYDRTIDVHIRNIRKKLVDKQEVQGDRVQTVFGLGYTFRPEGEA